MDETYLKLNNKSKILVFHNLFEYNTLRSVIPSGSTNSSSALSSQVNGTMPNSIHDCASHSRPLCTDSRSLLFIDQRRGQFGCLSRQLPPPLLFSPSSSPNRCVLHLAKRRRREEEGIENESRLFPSNFVPSPPDQPNRNRHRHTNR